MSTVLAWLSGFFAVWRLTNLFYVEHGPWKMFTKWRFWMNRYELTGELVGCPLCLSVWCAGIIGIFYALGKYVHPAFFIPIYILGWSGLTSYIFKQELTKKKEDEPLW